MDPVVADDMTAVAAKESWSADDHKALLRMLIAVPDAPRKFRVMLGELESGGQEIKGAVALKVGIARYVLCNYGGSLEALANATDNKDRRYFQALCFKETRQYGKAAEELERAKDRGWDGTDCEVQMAEVKALAGDLDGAAKSVGKLQNKLGGSADMLYLQGLIAELSGQAQEAMDAYEKARQTDPNHTSATFRLAYLCDLHGEEEQAVALYKELIARPPLFANALLNLAVIHEDAGQYDKAQAYLRRLLSLLPTHARARLFFKDIEAARCQFFDEDQAKRIARRNAVLDIPVTDFELSVRARNCLKKMNIRVLGDLVRATEADLLGYKNFGETSLKEIKDMLSSKGLRLGQALEENSEFAAALLAPAAPPPAPSGNEVALATPIAQVDLSIRARRALESLKVVTLGELANKTEAELLGCKNFGQTSLNEIRQRLTEHGLKLRDAT